jgi:regulatory protein
VKITVSPKGDRLYVMTLFVDEEPCCDFHLSIFGRRPAFKASDRQELDLQLATLEYRGARRFVLKRLAMKSYYSGELRAALEKRLVSHATIEKLLSEFLLLGFLNDREWVAGMARQLHQQKHGSRVILLKLRAKGVPEMEAAAAVQLLNGTKGERENIAKLLATRYRNRDLSDPKERQKVIASLVRKGYELTDIFAAIRPN